MARILGYSALRSQLTATQRNVGGQAFLRRVARTGATIVRNEARRTTAFHDRTGQGRKGIVAFERHAPQGSALFQIGFSRKKKKSGFYLKFIEGGTRAHRIDLHGSYLQRIYQANPGAQVKKTTSANTRRALKITLGGGANPVTGAATGGNVLFRRSIKHPGIAARPFLVESLRKSQSAVVTTAQLLINDALRRTRGVTS